MGLECDSYQVSCLQRTDTKAWMDTVCASKGYRHVRQIQQALQKLHSSMSSLSRWDDALCLQCQQKPIDAAKVSLLGVCVMCRCVSSPCIWEAVVDCSAISWSPCCFHATTVNRTRIIQTTLPSSAGSPSTNVKTGLTPSCWLFTKTSCTTYWHLKSTTSTTPPSDLPTISHKNSSTISASNRMSGSHCNSRTLATFHKWAGMYIGCEKRCHWDIETPLKKNKKSTGCHATVCLQCGYDAHPESNCEQNMKLIATDKATARDVKETVEWKLANSRQCPNCSIMINRDEGCNKVDCSYCGFCFCWACRSSWADVSFEAHWREIKPSWFVG